MEEILLVEQWNTPITVTEQPIDNQLQEQKGQKNALYIEGVFLQANVVNGNKRLYPKRVLEKAVDAYIKEQINTKQSLGELNHPPRPFADPLLSCLIIEKLWWEGDNVMGKARIVTGDNAQGDKVAALIKAGWVPGVSSRGLGKLVNKGSYNEVQEGFKLTVGVDIVWGPSAPNAFVKPIQEHIDFESQNDSYKQISNSSKNEDFANKLNETLQKFIQTKKDEKQLSSLAERINQKFNNK